jgi:hypothetical protein
VNRAAIGESGAELGDPEALALQMNLVAGARNTRFLRLVEREIPKLAA